MVNLTPPPIAPQRGDKSTFSIRLDAFITWIVTFVAQLVSLVSSLNTLAVGSAYAIPYAVDVASTTDADPGNGVLRFNSAVQNAATVIFTDLLGSDGVDYTSILDQLDASTSLTKGQLSIVKMGDPTKYLTFNVTARTAATGYRKLSVTNIGGSSASPFAAGDVIVLKFTRVGDKGDSGALTQVLWVRDEKASGTSAGSAGAGQTVQRTLNTVKRNTISSASLSANQVTVPAGTYRISMSVPAYLVARHQAWLYNVTDGAVLITGSTEYSSTGGRSTIMESEVVLSASKVLEVRHYTYAQENTDGQGIAASSGQTEVYTELFIEKIS